MKKRRQKKRSQVLGKLKGEGWDCIDGIDIGNNTDFQNYEAIEFKVKGNNLEVYGNIG